MDFLKKFSFVNKESFETKPAPFFSWITTEPPPPPPPLPLPADYSFEMMLSILIALFLITCTYLYYQSSKKPDKRVLIIQEILQTEKTYVLSLQQLFNTFINPLTEASESGKILPKDKLQRLFHSSLTVIRNTNEILLEKLTARLPRVKSSSKIGDIFIQMAPFLKCYTDYVNSYDVSQELLTSETKSSKTFRAFLKARQEFHLPNLMITPVQRLPRYVLLFQELLKHTKKEHPDYHNIVKVVELMKEITSHLNNNKELADNLNQVLRIEKMLDMDHIPSRKYIKEGFVREGKPEMNKKKDKDSNLVVLWLFNDCLVVGQKRKSFRTSSPKYKPEANILLSEISNIENLGFIGFGFQVGKKKFEFTAENDREAQDWISELQKAAREALDSIDSFKRYSLED